MQIRCSKLKLPPEEVLIRECKRERERERGREGEAERKSEREREREREKERVCAYVLQKGLTEKKILGKHFFFTVLTIHFFTESKINVFLARNFA